MLLNVSVLSVARSKEQGRPPAEGGTVIYGLYRLCAAVKGMVFKQFTLGN